MENKVGVTGNANSTYTLPFLSNSFAVQALHAGILSNVQQRSDIVGGSIDVSPEAMIAREIEKRRIREETIIAGILRRRELEDEVIREMMSEREITMRRYEGFSLVESPLSSLGSDLLGPFLKRRDEFGFEERLAVTNNPESGVLGRLPFQRLPGGTSAVAIKPLIDLSKGQAVSMRQPGVTSGIAVKPVIDLSKGKAVSMVKPTKRKFETPILAEWSCSLCQVRTNCEQGLKSHLKGKKHKAKEKASLRTTRADSNNLDNSDPLLEETEKSIKLAIPTGITSSNLASVLDGNQNTKKGKALDPEKQREDSGKINGGSPEGLKQNTLELNKNFKFWCTICNVGATSEASMMAHRMGKEHVTLLQKNGGGVIAITTMPDCVEYVNVAREMSADERKDVLHDQGRCQRTGCS